MLYSLPFKPRPALSPVDAELIEAVAKLVGIMGAVIAAGLALWQAVRTHKQREEDLRWKRSEMAKKLADEWFDYGMSRSALQMT